MLKTLLLITIALSLTACATTTRLTGKKGEKIYDIDCSGKIVKMSVCYEKARALCPQGYKTLPRDNKLSNSYPLNTSLGIATAIASSIPGVDLAELRLTAFALAHLQVESLTWSQRSCPCPTEGD